MAVIFYSQHHGDDGLRSASTGIRTLFNCSCTGDNGLPPGNFSDWKGL